MKKTNDFTQIPIFLLILTCCGPLFLSTQVKAMDYFIDEGKTLREVKAEESETPQAQEWQVWLYERGKPTGNPKMMWGMIRGRSEEDVARKLKNAKKFESKFESFFNLPEGSTKATFLNSSGPIAKIKTFKTSPQRVVEEFERLERAQGTLVQIIEIVADKRGEKDTYAEIWLPLRDYAFTLVDAQERMTVLMPLLTNGVWQSLTEVQANLNSIDHELDSAEKQLQKIRLKWPMLVVAMGSASEYHRKANFQGLGIIDQKRTILDGVLKFETFFKTNILDVGYSEKTLSGQIRIIDLDIDRRWAVDNPSKIGIEGREWVVKLRSKKDRSFSVKEQNNISGTLNNSEDASSINDSHHKATNKVKKSETVAAFYFESEQDAKDFMSAIENNT